MLVFVPSAFVVGTVFRPYIACSRSTACQSNEETLYRRRKRDFYIRVGRLMRNSAKPQLHDALHSHHTLTGRGEALELAAPALAVDVLLVD